MATLKQADLPGKVNVPRGKNYATALKWTPVQRFSIEVQPGWVLEMEMNNSQWFARYHGYCRVEMDTKGFVPDIFTLKKRDPYQAKDIRPQSQAVEDPEQDHAERLYRSFLVKETELDYQRLTAWKESRVLFK